MQAAPSENSLSGPYGLVIVPDRATQDAARTLARDISTQANDFTLAKRPDCLPHLTLYHGVLAKMDLPAMLQLRNRVESLLQRRELLLSGVEVAGGKFIFWNVDAAGPNYSELMAAHREALGLSQYLDRNIPSKARGEEGLKLTDGEIRNCEQYGHPWVGELYRPHITLAFHAAGIDDGALPQRAAKHSLTVGSVELVEIGFPGVIVRGLDLERTIAPRERVAQLNP